MSENSKQPTKAELETRVAELEAQAQQDVGYRIFLESQVADLQEEVNAQRSAKVLAQLQLRAAGIVSGDQAEDGESPSAPSEDA